MHNSLLCSWPYAACQLANYLRHPVTDDKHQAWCTSTITEISFPGRNLQILTVCVQALMSVRSQLYKASMIATLTSRRICSGTQFPKIPSFDVYSQLEAELTANLRRQVSAQWLCLDSKLNMSLININKLIYWYYICKIAFAMLNSILKYYLQCNLRKIPVRRYWAAQYMFR